MVTPLLRPLKIDPEGLVLTEKVVQVSRVAKVVKGGRHLSFNAMVVMGDNEGHVGAGLGKADAVPDAVRKGTAVARRSLISVPLKGTTIPHEIQAKFGATKIFLKPARPGTGIIAGGAARAVVELAGIEDIYSKCLGSSNAINLVKATLKALSMLRDVDETIAKRKATVTATAPVRTSR